MSGLRSSLRMGTIFNRTSYGGPRRLILIAVAGVTLLGGVVAVSMGGGVLRQGSHLTKLPRYNPLPGGTNSDVRQEALAKQTNQEHADQAAAAHESFLPSMPASHLVDPGTASPPSVFTRSAQVGTRLHPAGLVPNPLIAQPLAVNQVKPISATMKIKHLGDAAEPSPDSSVHTVALTPEQQKAETEDYKSALDRMLRGWDGRPPNTEVILSGQGPVDAHASSDGAAEQPTPRRASLNSNLSGSSPENRRQIMPAGRGVYGHTVLAADSDSGGPIIIQADSGPLAGDRMVGTFSKAGGGAGTGTNSDRLVVRINSVEHRGETLSADAIVIAPDTMETTVASSVDEHYVSRFLLPAAAAFVQGLGSALQTTSNTNGVLSPLGGTSFTEQLNIRQQLGVAAGSAAAQLGTTLNQQAPRGPTVHLDANSNIGVMFLTPLYENPTR